jgi:hypothetical protein
MIMTYRNLLALTGAVTLAIVTLVIGSARSAEPASPADGEEILTRGPVHEAYADPGTVRPQPSPVVPKQPPDPLAEEPPDQKPEGASVAWINGYWNWDEERKDFIWVSGFWRVPPPNRQWVPGSWTKVDDGWQWSPGYWAAATQSEVQYLPPPPDEVDAAASVPAPSDDSIYVSGCWVYRDSRYLWRPGYWLAYRPGWIWHPACYRWTPVGYVFVEGYWDYPLAERGLLFAPVYLRPRLYAARDFTYVPRYIVYTDFLFGALFTRLDGGCYYFGDYFGDRYARRGYTTWIDIRIGSHAYDPLFAFYRHHFASDRLWERDLRDLYVGRRDGEISPPPRTLVQQTKVIQNITNTTTTNVTNVRNVTVVAPLTQVDKKLVKLETVSREQRAELQKHLQTVREATVQRQKVETKLLSQGPPPTKPTDKPAAVKLDLPKPPQPLKGTAKAPAPPPPPELPKHQEKPLPNPPPPKKDSSQPPKKDAPPPPPKKEPPPPPPKKDESPPPKKESPPPPPKKDESPPPKKEPPPPPPKKDESPPSKKEPPPPPPKKDESPPPKKEPPPPAPPKKEPPPPAPPKKEPPPPPPKKDESPPPKKEPPPPAPPKKEPPPPAPPKKEPPPMKDGHPPKDGEPPHSLLKAVNPPPSAPKKDGTGAGKDVHLAAASPDPSKPASHSK